MASQGIDSQINNAADVGKSTESTNSNANELNVSNDSTTVSENNEIGEDSEVSDAEPSREVKLRVLALRKLHDERSSIEELYREEKRKLDQKYQALYEPLYDKRSGIVKGSIEHNISNEEISGIEELSNTNETVDSNEVGIPDFWLTALYNHGMIEQTITERDFPALQYLHDIRSIDRSDMKGFNLEFHFKPNPYFENEVLVKEYEVEQSIEGEAVLENVNGTEIKWKSGMNLCEHSVKKKQKSKSGRRQGQTRTITKVEPCASFFNLFNPVDLSSVEEDSDEHELLLRQLDSDFQIGYIIHDRIVPEAVLWYTGEAVDADSDYEPGEDYEDEELEDEEDEEEEEDEQSQPVAKHPFGQPNPSGEQPPECKNQ